MTIDSFLVKPWAGTAIALVFVLNGYALVTPRPVIGMILLIVGAVLLIGVVISKIVAAALPPPPGNLHTIGGAKMHIVAEGKVHESHPVIWVAGGHGEGLLMQHLHDGIKTDTRSITFDRPGSGWSGIGSLPLTVSGEVKWLKQLLDANDEVGPFVLAGHSFGGMFSVNFAHHYPELVAGLVLLDPTPPWNVAFAGRLSFGTTLRKSRWRALASQFGLSNLIEPEIDEEDSDYYRTLADVADVINRHSVEPKSLLAEASIFRSVIANPLDLVIGSGALGDVPLLLISANEGDDVHAATRASLKEMLGLTNLQASNLWDGLTDSVSQQARLSSEGRLLDAPRGASHMFPYEHPDFVLAEVRNLISKGNPETDA